IAGLVQFQNLPLPALVGQGYCCRQGTQAVNRILALYNPSTARCPVTAAMTIQTAPKISSSSHTVGKLVIGSSSRAFREYRIIASETIARLPIRLALAWTVIRDSCPPASINPVAPPISAPAAAPSVSL